MSKELTWIYYSVKVKTQWTFNIEIFKNVQ